MRSSKQFFRAGIATAMLALSIAAIAQATMAEGQVRKVDAKAMKITLTHGEIKSLDMGPMTMVYDVKRGVALDKIKAGDKVRFRAEAPGGKYTVTEIQLAK